MEGGINILKTEKGQKREKNSIKNSKIIDIPFIAYFMSLMVFVIPPAFAFVFSLCRFGVKRETVSGIFIPLTYLVICKQFLKDMRQGNIKLDFFSKLTYILLTEVFTYGLILIYAIGLIILYGWF